MPATIFGERFVGFKQPAWHGLGTVFNERLTVSEAVALADIGFDIHKAQNFARMDTGRYADNGSPIVHSIPTKSYSVLREPMGEETEWQVLSTVGEQWTPIQASDLATMLDPISQRYPVETAGAIGKGEKIFITLDAGGASIAGEDHNLYYLVTDHRDGTGALSMAFTPVRVVCQNTLSLGLSSAKVSVSLQHRKTIKEDADWYMNIFGMMDTARENSIEQMNTLTRLTIDDEIAKKVIDKSYPKPATPTRLRLTRGITGDDLPSAVWNKLLVDRENMEKDYALANERIQIHKDMAFEKYSIFNEEHPKVSKTPWAIWQAICETEDYRRGKEANGGRLTSALYGGRAVTKEKAFKNAFALVN